MADENLNVSGQPLEFDSVLNLQINDTDIQQKIDQVTKMLADGLVLPNNLKQQFLDAATGVKNITDNLANLKTALQNATGQKAIFVQKDIDNTEKFLQTAKDQLVAITDKILNLPQSKSIEVQIKTLSGKGQQGLNGLNSLMDSLIAKATATAKAMAGATDPASLEKYSGGLKVLQDQMNAVGAAMDDLIKQGYKMPDPLKNAEAGGQKALTAYTRLRQLINQLAVTPPGTEEWEKLSEEAGKLDNNIRNVRREILLSANNASGLEAMKETLRGLVGGFEAVAGAISLFGADSKEAEEATKKVIGAMGILNGLEEVASLLSSKSSVNFYLQAIAQRVLGESAVEAAAGQSLLNAALLANPLGVLVAAVGAVVGAYELYIHTLGAATEAQKEQLAVIKNVKEIADKAADSYAKEEAGLSALVETIRSEVTTRDQKEAALEKAQTTYPGYLNNLTIENASTAQGNTLIQRQIALMQQKALAQAAEEVYVEKLKDQIKAQNAVTEAVENYKNALSDNTNIGAWFAQDKIAKAQAKLNEATRAANIAMESQKDAADDLAKSHQSETDKLNDYIKKLQEFSDKSGGFIEAIREVALAGAQQQLKTASNVFDEDAYNAEKKKILENAEVRAELNKKNYDAQKGLIDATYTEELKRLKGVYGSGEAYDQGVKVATAKYRSDLKVLTDTFTQQWAADSAAAADAVVLRLEEAGKKGTGEYYEAQINAAKAAAREQVANANGDAGQIEKAYAQLALNIKNIAIARSNSELQAKSDEIDEELSLVAKGSQRELELQIKKVQIASQQELNALGLSADKREEIEVNAVQKIVALKSQIYYKGLTDEETVNTESIKARLAAVKAGSEQELSLKQQLISAEADQQVVAVRQSTDSEEVKQAKIKTIEAQAYNDRLKASKAFYDKLFDQQLAKIDSVSKSKNDVLQLTIDDKQTNAFDKIVAQKQQIDNDLDATEKKIIATELELSKTDAADNVKVKALQAKIKQLEADLAKLNIQAANTESDKAIAKLTSLSDDIGVLAQGFNALAQGAKDLNNDLFQIIGTAAELTNGVKAAVDGLKQIRTAALTKDAFGEIAGGLSIAGGVMSVVETVFNTIQQSQQSVKDSKTSIQSFQDSLVTGQVQYNELLRKQALAQQNINDLTYQELLTKQKLLDTQKQQAQADYDALLAQIQLSGKEITGEHTKKSGGSPLLGLAGSLLGFGQKTSVVQDLASISDTSYDNLLKLFTEGKLDAATAKWFQQLQQVHDELNSIGESAQEAADKSNEFLTGTTAQSITDSIVQGFANGQKSAADFADNFKQLMQKAVFDSLETKALDDPIQQFYQKFAAAAKSGDVLSQSEIQQLQEQYNNIIANAGTQFDQLQKITQIDLTPTDQNNSLAGAIKGITEQQADILDGQVGGIHQTVNQQLAVARSGLVMLTKIEANTARLETVQNLLTKFDTQGIKLR